MKTTKDQRNLVLTLYNGYNYEELIEDNPSSEAKPFRRTEFSKQIIKFDLSAFNLERTDQEMFRSNHQMMNLTQLTHYIDSLQAKIDERQEKYLNDFKNRFRYYSKLDTIDLSNISFKNQDETFNSLLSETSEAKSMIISNASNVARTNNEFIRNNHKEFRQRKRSLARYEIEFQRKFTLSVACIVLFLIGAPMGALIRKGGFGLPLVIAVLFFVAFHVISVMGEKFARELVLPAWQGMWLAPLILLPTGIILSLKATTDSEILNLEKYSKLFGKFSRFVKSKLSNNNNNNLEE